MKISETNAIARISEFGMDDMPLVEYTPVPTKLPADWFVKYRELCHKFMESLMDSMYDIVFMNLQQDEYVNLIMGKALPDNLSIRFRVPLIWGGNMDALYLHRHY